MGDGAVTDSAGWNVDTLKEYMDSQHTALREALESQGTAHRDALAAVVLSQQLQNKAQEEAIKVASAANALALTEAKVGPQKQFDVLAVKMDELVSRAGGSVPRGELEALLISVGQRAETQIADAVTAMTRQFSSDISQVTKALEAQGKAILSLTDSVNELNTIQVGRQGAKEGLSSTGRAVTWVAGILVAVMTLVGGLYAIFHK